MRNDFKEIYEKIEITIEEMEFHVLGLENCLKKFETDGPINDRDYTDLLRLREFVKKQLVGDE